METTNCKSKYSYYQHTVGLEASLLSALACYGTGSLKKKRILFRQRAFQVRKAGGRRS